MTSIDDARALIIETRAVLGHDRTLDARIVACQNRLDAPLRIALAGTVKAGKSTLLNALIGEEVAPSDATECTRVVTWFVRGRTPSVTVTSEGNARSIPVVRQDGRLTLDLGETPAGSVDRLEVAWPSTLLDRYTVVDTPGTASNSREVSQRTMDVLTPPSGRSDIDAVVYLTRDPQASDVAMLESLRGRGAGGPLGVIAVRSRADEADGGREWDGRAEHSTIHAASEMLPVSGLLALRGRTLRQSEFDAFRVLATEDALDRSLVSVDRFARAALAVDPDVRRHLAVRFGLFGIRTAVSIVRSGVSTASGLAAELVARSGLNELQRRIDTQFGDRHRQLRVHSVLTVLQGLVEHRLDARSASLLTKIDRALADDHLAEELAVLADVQVAPVGTTDWQREAMQRILGGNGIEPHQRLGIHSSADESAVAGTARAAVRYWRAQLANPLLVPSAARAYRAAARSAEDILGGCSSERQGRQSSRVGMSGGLKPMTCP